MTYFDFRNSLEENQPPAHWPTLLQALWYDAQGDWNRSHTIAQDVHTWEGSWVHAYLHREEGDEWNANYWYQRAGKVMPSVPLTEEFETLVKYFIKQVSENL